MRSIDNWVDPPMEMLKKDELLCMLIKQRDEAKATVESCNRIINHRMLEVSPEYVRTPIKDLTPNQRNALNWICQFRESFGFSPTNTEICEGLNFKSNNSGNAVVGALVNKGYIKKVDNKWRGAIPVFDSSKNRIL